MVRQYLLSHGLTALALVASLVMLVRLFESRRTPQSTFAWLLAIVFVPFVAIPLFLLLGQRKFPRRAKRPSGETPKNIQRERGEAGIAYVLRRSGTAPARAGNAFEILTTGEAAFARLTSLVRDAERSIDLTMFIIGNDPVGRGFVEALAERAENGVSVRVIVDAVGTARLYRYAAHALKAKGAEVRAFMPLRHSPIRGRTNLRSHRKIAIIDANQVFVGGMNLASEYMGPPQPESSKPRWRDVAAVVAGPVAADATALFESDWAFCGGAPREVTSSQETRGDDVAQLVASGPDMLGDTVYDAFLTGIFEARERLALVTPYYVPDETLQHALILAARRGVRTEVLVPSSSNHRIADIARRALLRELTANGVVVHYYPRGMVHAKAMVIDDACAYIGSPNFDMRSLFLNYEDALFVYSPNAIGEIRAFIDELIRESVREGPNDRPNWLVEQVARLLAPEL